MAVVNGCFPMLSNAFGISDLNEHQKLAIQKVVHEKCDIFVNLPTGYGKSLINQALPLAFDFAQKDTGNIVVVVSPLVSLMEDQVSHLRSLGLKAVNISSLDKEDEITVVESGCYSLVYGSPEAWIKNERWRRMLSNSVYSKKLCAIAVDEAHVVKQWGTSINKKLAPFREAYSRLHEVRSLAPNVPIIALTATATTATKKTIFDILRMRSPYDIFESPDKANITYSVEYLPKDVEIVTFFGIWLVEELVQKKMNCDRTIIYCQTINQCALLFATLRGLLGKHLMVQSSPLIEMLHSCTPVSNKQKILDSFAHKQGSIRVLIATIAFGMGINCKAVRRVIHFGPSKNIESYVQETGRAGRDGVHSSAFLLFNGMLMSHVEGDIKSYIESKECRRHTLLAHFQAENSTFNLPKHLCCDLCATECQCGSEDCKEATTYPTTGSATHYKPTRSREVSPTDFKKVENMLKIYHKSLLTQLMNTVPNGNVNTITNVSFLLGFSEVQINQALDNLHSLFSINDICNFVEIWDSQHSKKILKIVNDVFGDVCLDEVSDENMLAEAILLDEWEMFFDDDELLDNAADNLFQESQIATGQHQLSQLAEDSFYDNSINELNTTFDVPSAICDALSQL